MAGEPAYLLDTNILLRRYSSISVVHPQDVPF